MAIIGGGSGGYAAAAKLGEYGLKTVVIEKAAKLGGLCILRGCMPSKALIESANLMRKIRSAAEFGIHVDGVGISMDEVQNRKERLISGFQSYREEQLDKGKFDLVRGEASFVEPKSLKVIAEDRESVIDFDYAIIATGSVPLVPDITGLRGGDFWLSRDALNARVLPKELLIIGGGAIGCEMAHCFEGFGSKVTIIQCSGCLLTDFDKDIGGLITEVSKNRGIQVLCDTKVERVRWESSGKVTLELKQRGEPLEVSGDKLLIAVGREPATESLDLKTAGVKTEKGRVKTNFHMQSNIPHIFAIGDSTSELPVVHEAVMQGEAVAEHIANLLGILDDGIAWKAEPGFKLFGIFTHPECARAGLSEEMIAEEKLLTEYASYKFSDHGKAEIIGETDGFVKIISEKGSGRILSASAIGPHVIDLIHELQVAIYAGLTVKEFAKIPHYHPTLAEIWTYPAGELVR